MIESDGTTVSAMRVCSREIASMTSRCSRLRRSAIEKNATTSGGFSCESATKRVSWPKVRSESVAGISGTRRVSDACSTFSDTSEMLGGQSRKTMS